ncbi:MAG: nuclear transport factor 2 family protein [Gammaproteobacteria bacterium]|nr:MAG: nuclear transport factor 2 family protein [Gammaproteobacteria bacterium]
MTDTELIELARAYIALSNSHRVDLIMPMFAAGARYTSSAVGEHRGRAAIGDMMHGFFNRFPDAYWLTSDFSCSDHCVSFDFTMQATEADSGEGLERKGVERVEFTADGSIKKLTVEIE